MPTVSRYTEWSIISRTVIIDRFIAKLIDEGIDTVVNLGAGLDTRPYRMNLPANLVWVEVDHPQIIAHKNHFLKSEKLRCQLIRVELDLADREKRREFMSQVSTNAKKILVLTEGVIPYLSPKQVLDLAEDLLAQEHFLYWIAEYLNPRIYPHLQNTVRAAKMQNSPFLFYPEDWMGFFKKAGWVCREIHYTGEIALEFKRRPPMPWWVNLIWPLIPQKNKDESMRMYGYVVFQR